MKKIIMNEMLVLLTNFPQLGHEQSCRRKVSIFKSEIGWLNMPSWKEEKWNNMQYYYRGVTWSLPSWPKPFFLLCCNKVPGTWWLEMPVGVDSKAGKTTGHNCDSDDAYVLGENHVGCLWFFIVLHFCDDSKGTQNEGKCYFCSLTSCYFVRCLISTISRRRCQESLRVRSGVSL